jgi:hypothetical protein
MNVFNGQRVQAVAATSMLYLPATQIAHALALAARTALLDFPAAQSAQAAAPSPS